MPLRSFEHVSVLGVEQGSIALLLQIVTISACQQLEQLI
jgi:hypothetical protein